MQRLLQIRGLFERMTNKTLLPKNEYLPPLAYSIAESCRVTSLGRTRIYELIKQGRLQTRKIGKRTLIPAASLHSLIEGEG